MVDRTPHVLEDAASTKRGTIHVGCAGWSLPSSYRPHFDEAGSALARYASRFNAVEINSSFYRPHQPKTYERWASAVPADFRFSVKLPGTITHDLSLVGTATPVDRFLGECLRLGSRLGGLLVQLPPSLAFDGRRANAFFGVLRRRLPDAVAIACEPRHPTWFGHRATGIWRRYRVNRIFADPPVQGVETGDLPSATGDWRYWRLHGSPRMYFSSYPDASLEHLAPRLLQAARTSNVWVIFDNTAHGHAVANALTLQRLLASKEPSQREAADA